MVHTRVESSSNSGDSNAVILPCKNKKKSKNSSGNKKNAAKVLIGKGKKLSKSQKRKIRKLEEEKEQKQLLAKSVEILEKYKIDEDVYKLLWSSRSLGQAETSKEKRRRIMQFSQAGLEVPHTDSRKKTQFSDDCSNTSELEDEAYPSQVYEERSIFMKPLVVQEEGTNEDSVLPDSSLQQICEDKAEETKITCTKSVIEENSEEHVQSTGVTSGALSTNASPCSMQENSTAVDDISGTQREKFDSTKSVVNHSSQGGRSKPIVVHVSRPEEVESKRKDLPIVMMEREIMEAINENTSLIICGETGCGKTTQVPQFLYESGFGSKLCSTRSGVIGVTQPRRVAVLATARRVAFELGLRLGSEVGFQVRHDRRIGENCAIKFMTDGILLREVQGDILLKRYSVLILDEAHERSLNTDILIGMLSRVIVLRQAEYEEQQKKLRSGGTIDPEARIFPLKLILMSATLKVEDFTLGERIFSKPPRVMTVETRQYKVTIHSAKRTEIFDYIGQAYKKVLSIHKNLPPGGILVFVTGQREVENLCDKLRKASKDLVKKSSKIDRSEVNKLSMDTNFNVIDGYDMKEIIDALEVNDKSSQQQTDRFSWCDEPAEEAVDEDSDFSYHSRSESDVESESDTEIMEAMNVEDDDDLAETLGQNGSLEALKASFAALAGKTVPKPELEDKQKHSVTEDGGHNEPESSMTEKKGGKDKAVGPMCVLPLYAMLPAADQLRVFSKVKEGERLVIVATNVAETSLTIPGIKYVVDTGREKVKEYNSSNGMESYKIQWISKASASQRAGRSGRTGPGHCYRLYSSTVFSNFDDFACAEISKIPVDGVVLLMKSMGIPKVETFPFPTPPDTNSLKEADNCLKALEALDQEGRLTSLGKTMSQYPMSPRHSRMLLTAIQVIKKNKHHVRSNLVVGYAIAAASALSVSNPFLLQFQESLGKSGSQDEKPGSLGHLKTAVKLQKSMRKKLKETARFSRAKFSNIKSDALTVAYALQCFELSQDKSEFCINYALHFKSMEEMSKLRTQLLHLVFQSSSKGMEEEYKWSEGTQQDIEKAWRVNSEKFPLTKTEEDLLLGAICSGWVDRVAKRVTRAHRHSEGDKTVNAVSYHASKVEEKVYLHRWSSVSKSAPEFLVYSELLHTKRPYIHGASSVQSEWLVQYARSLCTFSAPLTDPKPGYDPHTDQVYCHVIPYFGPNLWELPYHKTPIDDVVARVTVFGYALLDGQVLPCLKSVSSFMAAQPSVILKRESLGVKRVGNLLSKLNSRSRTIDNCGKLKEAWMKNPMELYVEIRSWFQAGFHNQFDGLWAKMQSEVLLSPQERFSHKSKKRKKMDRSRAT
ncbi:hypothetical protein V2J09_003132 [Rumex salicifolius]